MRHPELPGDVAWPDPVVRQLHDALPHHVGQGAPVDEDAAQLVHAAVACDREREGSRVRAREQIVTLCVIEIKRSSYVYIRK